MNDLGNKANNDILIDKNLTGIVTKYLPEKGFGFLKMFNSNISNDIFVYHNQIKNIDKTKEYVKLQINQNVTFDLYSTPRGYVAKNVFVQGMNQNAAVNIFKNGNI